MNSPDQSSKRRNLAVIAVIINDEGKALLTQRHQPESHHSHGKWQFPGGGIEHGEHPIDAVQREIQEEVGKLKVEILSETPFLFSDFEGRADVHTILLGFPVKYILGEIDVSMDDETNDARWFDVEEVKHLDIRSGTLEFLERALTYLP